MKKASKRKKLENGTYQTNLESLVEARTDQLQAAMANLERSYDITLEALGDALDLKDKETAGHSRRVTAFAIAIARAMGLAGDQIRIIARGAFLHDIGKLTIPDAILLKPGNLTGGEIATMHEHCYKGYQIRKEDPIFAGCLRHNLFPSRTLGRNRLPAWTEGPRNTARSKACSRGEQCGRDHF